MKEDAHLAAKLLWQLLHKLSGIVRLGNERLTASTITLDESVAPEDGAA